MRINGCRQWLLHNPRARHSLAERYAIRRMKGIAFCRCIHFFDLYYLRPQYDEQGIATFDPGFYKTTPYPSPEYHWHVNEARMMHRNVAGVGPRGAAKTVGICAKPTCLQLISRPNFPISYATSKDDLAERFGESVKFSLYHNQRIIDDWTKESEFRGRIQPPKGEPQGMSSFKLGNRSSLFCTSAQSRQRGDRPLVYILDDPEWDATNSTPMEELRGWFEKMLFNIVLPMLRQSGTNFVWTGTFVSQQHFLWHVMETKKIILPDGTQQEVSAEPRFNKWYRIIQPAFIERTKLQRNKRTGETRKKTYFISCWPHMWPVDEAQKKELDLPDDADTMEDLKEILGIPVFEAEMMARPGTGTGAHFPEHTKEKHGYWFERYDDLFHDKPYLSQTLLCWSRTENKKLVDVKMPLHEFCTKFARFVTSDPSDTATAHSDFKTAVCMALTDHNELFILDCWQDQCDEPEQVQASLEMCARWRAMVWAIEALRSGASLCSSAQEAIKMEAMAAYNVDYLPEILALKGGGLQAAKCDKIGAMKWRYSHGLIKYWWDGRGANDTAWPMMFYQSENFKKIGSDNTGLQKDDLIDTVSMSRFVLAGVPDINQPIEDAPNDLLTRLKNGEKIDPRTGISLFVLAFPHMDRKDLEELYMANRNRKQKVEADYYSDVFEGVA